MGKVQSLMISDFGEVLYQLDEFVDLSSLGFSTSSVLS
jgi:hypothetical protein